MKNKKLSKVFASVVLIILGVLIAIFGTKTIDVYIGIVACTAGALVLADTIYLLTRKEELAVHPFVISLVLIAVGIAFFTPWIGFDNIVNFLVIVMLGTGAGLLCYGAYLIGRKENNSGLLNVIIGVLILTLAILYMTVADFRSIFWIITGIVIAVYGVLGLVFALIEKN